MLSMKKLEIKIVTNEKELPKLLGVILKHIKEGYYLEGKWHEVKDDDKSKDHPSTSIYRVIPLDTL